MKRKRQLKPKFEAARDNREEAPAVPKAKQRGSYRDLKKKVGPTFDYARDWEAEQRQKLTDEQRRRFDELKKERKKVEKKKKKAIERTQKRIAEETEKRSRLDLDLTPRNSRPFSKLVGIGRLLNRQRVELKKYQEERQQIETRFLKNSEGNALSREVRDERAKKPVIRRARRRRSRDRGDADRSR